MVGYEDDRPIYEEASGNLHEEFAGMYGLFRDDKRIKLIDLKIPYGSCIVFITGYFG